MTSETEAKAVRITAAHAAKGLERPVVVLAGTDPCRGTALHRLLKLCDEDGAMIEGVVDLLYREPEGDYVVVDHTTDKALSRVSLEACQQQLSLCAGQLEGTIGGRVGSRCWCAAGRRRGR